MRCGLPSPGHPEVVENTLKIADQVEVNFEKKYHVPEFSLAREPL